MQQKTPTPSRPLPAPPPQSDQNTEQSLTPNQSNLRQYIHNYGGLSLNLQCDGDGVGRARACRGQIRRGREEVRSVGGGGSRGNGGNGRRLGNQIQLFTCDGDQGENCHIGDDEQIVEIQQQQIQGQNPQNHTSHQINKRASYRNSQNAKLCRICLQSEPQPPQNPTPAINCSKSVKINTQVHKNSKQSTENQLISPCRCTGSLKYIHRHCLIEWIEKLIDQSFEKGNGSDGVGNGRVERNSMSKLKQGRAHICCQLCTTPIYFLTHNRLSCKPANKILPYFLQNIKTFILLLLLLLTNLGFFSALLNYLLFVGFTTLKSNNFVLVSLIISGMVIFSIVAVVTFGCMVRQFLVGRRWVVGEILGGGGRGEVESDQDGRLKNQSKRGLKGNKTIQRQE